MEAAHSGGELARIALAQLWLSEGIPHGFHCCPAIYDAIRCWLGNRLGVHPKDVSLVGSARLGKSLSPDNPGKPFDSESDLDLFIVSSKLFDELRQDFYRWSSDYENERKKPRNDLSAKYWRENYLGIPGNIEQGFIDANKIPYLQEYSIAQNIGQTMWQLIQKLKITPSAPKPIKASVRCYCSWSSFVRQTLRNLEALAKNNLQHTRRVLKVNP